VRRRRGTVQATRPPFPPPLFHLGRQVDAARGGEPREAAPRAGLGQEGHGGSVEGLQARVRCRGDHRFCHRRLVDLAQRPARR